MDSANIARLAGTEELQKEKGQFPQNLYGACSQGYHKRMKNLLVAGGQLLTISTQESDK